MKTLCPSCFREFRVRPGKDGGCAYCDRPYTWERVCDENDDCRDEIVWPAAQSTAFKCPPPVDESAIQ